MATNLQEISILLDGIGLDHTVYRKNNSIVASLATNAYTDSSGEKRLPVKITIDNDGTYVKITGPYTSTLAVEPGKHDMLRLACFLITSIMEFTRFEIGLEGDEMVIKPFVEIPLQDAPLTQELLHAHLMDLHFDMDALFWFMYHSLVRGEYMINNLSEYNRVGDFGRIWNLPELLALMPLRDLEAAMLRKRAIAAN